MDKGLVTMFTTFPDMDSAKKFAHMLVSDRLVACVNLLEGVESVYLWEGEVRADREVMLMIKTRKNRVDVVKRLLVNVHTYDLPECIVMDIDGGYEPYLEWVRSVGD